MRRVAVGTLATTLSGFSIGFLNHRPEGNKRDARLFCCGLSTGMSGALIAEGLDGMRHLAVLTGSNICLAPVSIGSAYAGSRVRSWFSK